MTPQKFLELSVSLGIACFSLLVCYWLIWWYLIIKGWLKNEK